MLKSNAEAKGNRVATFQFPTDGGPTDGDIIEIGGIKYVVMDSALGALRRLPQEPTKPSTRVAVPKNV